MNGRWAGLFRKSLFVLTITIASTFGLNSSAHADEVSSSIPGVFRVVVVAHDPDGEVVAFGLGTGFAISSRIIVTNAHVVRPSESNLSSVTIRVIPAKAEKALTARLKRVDASKDLALLEVKTPGLQPLTVYTGNIPDGSQLAALGYPANVDLATATSIADFGTATDPIRSQGNYSNLRVISGINAVLHTAAISRGSSGGPLLDECGRVVGINTFTTKSGAGDAQFSFAISAKELSSFLRRAGLSFREVSSTCLSPAERTAAAQARSQNLEERKRIRLAAQQRAREAQEADRAAISRRSQENWIAAAVIAGIFGAVLMITGGVLCAANRIKSGLGAATAGLLLLVVGAAAFFGRPVERETAKLDSELQEGLLADGEAPLNAEASSVDEEGPDPTTDEESDANSVETNTPGTDFAEETAPNLTNPTSNNVGVPTDEYFDTNGL